jgi:hypothetical protein
MALGVNFSGMNNEKHNLENVSIGNNSSTFTLICPIIFLDFLTLEDGTHTLSQNIGKGLPLILRNIPEEHRSQLSLKFKF